jgi:hypothetical protein
MKNTLRMLVIAFSLAAAGSAHAQGDAAGTPVANTARTSQDATCPSGKVIPAGTAIPDAYVNDPQSYFCGSSSSSSKDDPPTPAGLDPAMQTLYQSSYELGEALGARLRAAAQRRAAEQAAARQRAEEEAARKHAEEVQRREEMFQRLGGELKNFDGATPSQLKDFGGAGAATQLKDFGSGSGVTNGLQLKDFGGGTQVINNDLQPNPRTNATAVNPCGAAPNGSPAGANTQGLQLKDFGGGDSSSSNGGGCSGGSTATPGNTADNDGACRGTGIPGLPGVYLNTCHTTSSSAFLSANPVQLAQGVQSISGPDREAMEESILRAAESKPELTAPSQDPRVSNFQAADADYQRAEQTLDQASRTLDQAQQENGQTEAVVNVAQSEAEKERAAGTIPPPALQKLMNNLNAVAKTDEDAVVKAQEGFDTASANAAVTRTHAINALAAIASPAEAPPVNLSEKQPPRIVHPEDLKPSTSLAKPEPIAPGPPAPAAARVAPNAARVAPTAVQLRAEIAGLRQALLRLSQFQAVQSNERAEWEKTSSEASLDAWNRGVEMVKDAGPTMLENAARGELQAVDDELQSIVTKRTSDNLDSAARQALDTQFKTLSDEKKQLTTALDTAVSVNDHLEALNATMDLNTWGLSKPEDLQSKLDRVRQTIDTALQYPEVKEALRLSESGASAIDSSKSILDSTYDISAEVISFKRISQLNENSDQYLAAVKELQAKMQSSVQQLKALEQAQP